MPVNKKPQNIPSQISEGALSSVLTEYGVSNWQFLKKIEQGEKIVESGNEQGTARKAFVSINGKAHVLKEVPWYCSDPDFVEAVVFFQDKVSQAGICVPHICRTFNGLSNVKYEDSFFTLQEVGAGVAWSTKKSQALGMAHLLSEFHNASARLSCSNQEPDLHRESVFSISQNMLCFCEEEILEKAPDLKRYDKKALSSLVEQLEDDLALVSMQAVKSSYSAVQIAVHGDYNPTNLLFSNVGQALSLFDFDNACIDNPVHDLVQAILHTSFFNFRGYTSRFGEVPSDFDYSMARDILRTYLSNSSFEHRYITGNLAYASRAVATELVVLGLLSGSYSLKDIPRLRKLPEEAEKNMAALLSAETALSSSPLHRLNIC